MVLHSISQWFNPNAKSLIGIDISSTSAKLLELSRKDQRFCVESFAVVGKE